MGKKTKTPKAPNYTAVAGQQEAANKAAWESGIQANRPNQSNPMGSLKWDKDPVTGEWTQTTSWNPQQQETFNQQQANQGTLAGKVGGMLGGFDTSQIDFGGAPAMPTVGGYNQQAIDTMRALQSPQLQRQRAAKEAQLAAMGVGTGTGGAWNAEQSNIGERENQADMQAIMAGINQGNVEFGQGMQSRQQGVNEILNQRTANLGQLSGLMGLGSELKTPEFAPVGNVGQYNPADLMGATNSQYQAALDKANAQNADKSNMMSGLGSIAGIGASIF